MPELRARSGIRAGPGSWRARIRGVETVRARGTPTVVNSGMVSKTPITIASSPNDVAVDQLRWERCAHEVSSKLSANMASSSQVLGAGMDTANGAARAG